MAGPFPICTGFPFKPNGRLIDKTLCKPCNKPAIYLDRQDQTLAKQHKKIPGPIFSIRGGPVSSTVDHHTTACPRRSCSTIRSRYKITCTFLTLSLRLLMPFTRDHNCSNYLLTTAFKAGLLTSGSFLFRAFPFYNSGVIAKLVPSYSGGPVPDLHGVPFQAP